MESFVAGHQAVFMLNADDIVIADHSQVADDILPLLIVMAITDGTEDPGTVNLVAIMFGIQHAVDRCVDGVNLRILCMKVINRLAQLADGSHRINTLPKQMTGFPDCTRRNRDAFQSKSS